MTREEAINILVSMAEELRTVFDNDELLKLFPECVHDMTNQEGKIMNVGINISFQNGHLTIAGVDMFPHNWRKYNSTGKGWTDEWEHIRWQNELRPVVCENELSDEPKEEEDAQDW